MQSRYGFDFSLSGSVIVSFSVRVDVLSFGLTAGWVHGLWFPFAITAGEFGSLGARVTRAPGPGKSEEGETQDGIFQGLLRLKISGGPRVPGKWLQSHCSCPGLSAVTRSPTWGFFFLFLCYLCNASKDDFGNIQTSCDRSSSSVYFPCSPAFFASPLPGYIFSLI